MVEAVAEPDELHVGRWHQHRRLSRERQPELLVPAHGPRSHSSAGRRSRRRAEEREEAARGGGEVDGENGSRLPTGA